MKRKCIGKILGIGGAILLAMPVFAQTGPAPIIPNQPILPIIDNNDKILTSPNIAVNPSAQPVVSVPGGELEIKSVLFSDSDINSIKSARAFYEQTIKGGPKGKITEDDFLKKLEKVTNIKLDTATTSFTYPQFFLSSIAYYSQKDWVVWINNEKITQDSGLSASGLLVTHIDGNKVGFEWLPTRMDKIVDSNDETLDNPVKVDMVNGKVNFTLKTNQTFTSYAMQVVEGKVVPVTITETANVPSLKPIK